jgi:hypothetical protein
VKGIDQLAKTSTVLLVSEPTERFSLQPFVLSPGLIEETFQFVKFSQFRLVVANVRFVRMHVSSLHPA